MLPKQKGAKYERDKMPKHQTERQTTDMTENRIKEEEKEGFQKFLSAGLFSLSFFLFQLCFRKKNKLLSNERFFFKRWFCANYMRNFFTFRRARFLERRHFTRERERER